MTEYNKGFECGKQRVLKYPEDFNLCEKSDSTWSEKDESKFKFLYHLLEQNLEIHGSYSFSDVKELGYVTNGLSQEIVQRP